MQRGMHVIYLSTKLGKIIDKYLEDLKAQNWYKKKKGVVRQK